MCERLMLPIAMATDRMRNTNNKILSRVDQWNDHARIRIRAEALGL